MSNAPVIESGCPVRRAVRDDAAVAPAPVAGHQFVARLHEARLYLASQPLLWLLAGATGRIAPMVRVPGIGVVVSGADETRNILLRVDDFTKAGPGTFADHITQLAGPTAVVNMEGEAHRALRTCLASLLTPAHAATLVRDVCAAPIGDMHHRLACGETVDLVRFMRQLTGATMARLLGIEPAPGDEAHATESLARLVERLGRIIEFKPGTARWQREIEEPGQRLLAMLRSACERAPAGSVAHLLRAHGRTGDESAGVLALMLAAGTLTLTVALPRIVALLIDTGQFERLHRNPGLVGHAVNEGLRVASPLPATMRVATRDTSVGSRRVRTGTRLLILTMNAAHDPLVFPHPNRFDAGRVHGAAARHLWYGAGPHFCAGYLLAQRQLIAVLESLASVPGRMRIVRRAPAHRVLLPGYASLLVSMERRSAPGGAT